MIDVISIGKSLQRATCARSRWRVNNTGRQVLLPGLGDIAGKAFLHDECVGPGHSEFQSRRSRLGSGSCLVRQPGKADFFQCVLAQVHRVVIAKSP